MTDLQWTTSWNSVIAYEDQLLPNIYTVTIHFDVATDNAEDQNIAFERIKFFVDNILHDAIFCGIDDPLADFFMKTFKQRLVTFVRSPQDLTVAATLFAKFNSIADGKINIESIQLGSTQGNEVFVNFDSEFAEESTMLTTNELIKESDRSPWWFREDCGTADYFKTEEGSSVITLITDVSGWEDSGLSWSADEKENKIEKSWNPTIIPGGKTQH